MSRFTRFSRISPLELARERERRAWCCALSGLALLLSFAVAALALPAQEWAFVHESPACFHGFWVVSPAEPLQESAARSALAFTPPPAPSPAVQLEVQPELPEPEWLPECLPEDGVELSPEPLMAEDLPEFDTEPANRPPRAVAAQRASDAAPAEPSSAARPPAEFVAASYRHTPAPPWPATLRSRRVQGSVGLRVAVDAQGEPTRVEVCATSGHAALDRCARDWVLAHWHFHPARRGGVAVASTVRTQVDFVLR